MYDNPRRGLIRLRQNGRPHSDVREDHSSKSVEPKARCTASNHFIQQFFDPMTAYTGRTKYILSEFGIAFTLVVGVLGAYFWTRRAEVGQPR